MAAQHQETRQRVEVALVAPTQSKLTYQSRPATVIRLRLAQAAREAYQQQMEEQETQPGFLQQERYLQKVGQAVLPALQIAPTEQALPVHRLLRLGIQSMLVETAVQETTPREWVGQEQVVVALAPLARVEMRAVIQQVQGQAKMVAMALPELEIVRLVEQDQIMVEAVREVKQMVQRIEMVVLAQADI